MQVSKDRARRLFPLALGIATLGGVVLLFVEDAAPRLFPARNHESLAAFSLAMIAAAYLVFQLMHRRPRAELAKAILLAAAFLFWAANQFWQNLPQASLFNDIAIGLFVLDVFLVIAGWPAGSTASLLDDSCGSGANRCGCQCECCDPYQHAQEQVTASGRNAQGSDASMKACEVSMRTDISSGTK